jgi:hypothetical protein
MITPEFRAEFVSMGRDDVRKRINAGLYPEEKQKQAYEWLDEQERGPDREIAASAKDAAWESARAAQGANQRATIALVVSIISVAIAVAGIVVPHFWK